MSDSRTIFQKHGRRLAIGAGSLALAALVFTVVPRLREKPGAMLETPVLALTDLSAKSLYYNGAARPWLLAQRPELLTAEDRDERSDRSRGLVQAVQNPKLFRQLDRRYHFDTLLLVGDPSQYRPLLDHLLETKDWTATYLDHTSLVFRREGTAAWKVADVEPLMARFPLRRERALVMAQIAVKLMAIRKPTDAKALLDQAEALDPKVPDVWNGIAMYRSARGEWPMALKSVDRALSLDDEFLPAIATKAQIFFSTKRFGDAFDLSNKLIEAFPDDPGVLFYHAKICHEAHAYAAEIRTLRTLIERAEAEARPTTGYRLYLAQAFAADSQAEPSIEQFTLVLADPDLSPAQRQFAQETLAQIKSRTGL